MTVVQIARAPVGAFTRWRATRTPARRALSSGGLFLAVGTTILLGVGLVMILSASWVSAYISSGSSFVFFARQAVWVLIGLAAMMVTSHVDYRRWRALSYGLLALTIAGLVLVLIPGIGVRVGGSSRWLVLGPMRFQPSEMAKLALLLTGADLCVRKGRRLRTYKDVLVPYGIIAGIVGALVMAQPDLGTTIILGGITGAVLFVGGVRLRILSGFGLTGLGAGAMLAMSAGYRRARIASFADPFSDPLNAGYQAVQSQIALGSGGLFGVGLGAGRQKWLYVPNAHTDFIFSIIGEEVGLIGTFGVIALFVLVAYAGVRIAQRAPDAFGRIVAGGATAWIAGQAVINMGAVTGLMPITGVPLPLVSFGGSSLLFTLIAIGILLNIARQEPPGPVPLDPRS
ncbi:MAG TPA: putative lipid II flippase FtsW [Actinomycetota bacterium]